MPAALPIIPEAGSPASNIPAGFAAPVVPDTPFSSASRGIYVSGTGDISAVMAGDGATVIFIAVPSGSVLPIRCTEITVADTTATDMIVLW